VTHDLTSCYILHQVESLRHPKFVFKTHNSIVYYASCVKTYWDEDDSCIFNGRLFYYMVFLFYFGDFCGSHVKLQMLIMKQPNETLMGFWMFKPRENTLMGSGKKFEKKYNVWHICCWVKIIIQFILNIDYIYSQNSNIFNISYALIMSI
jgi:hypothetical protein